MKTFLTSLLVLALTSFTQAQRNTERITSYHSDITINPDTSIDVTETIQVHVTGENIKRGIFRDFPQTYAGKYGLNRTRGFKLHSITLDQSFVPFTRKKIERGTRLLIGDPTRLVTRGPHTYTIKYTTTRQLGYFENHDELYWNVTGNGWNFPIEQASATIHLPNGAEIITKNAWTGDVYSTAQNATYSNTTKNSTTLTTTESLTKNEGLTFKIKFTKGHLDYANDPTNMLTTIRDNPLILGLGITFLALLIFLFTIWFRHGRDPKPGTIIPLYEAPEGLSAAAIRQIYKTHHDDTTFTAAILGLAAKGALTITEKHNTHTLTKKQSNQDLTEDEAALYHTLFGKRTTLKLERKNARTLHSAKTNLERNLNLLTQPTYYSLNNLYARLAGLVFASILIITTFLSPNYSSAAPIFHLIITAWLYISFKSLIQLNRSANTLKRITTISSFLLLLIAWIFIFNELMENISIIAATICLLIEILITTFALINKAYTKKGRKTLDHILGLRKYLTTAEKDRLNLENPPERTPQHFEKFLPYALALGVEQQWSEQFHDILEPNTNAETETTTQYTPSFYTGSSSNSWASLGAAGAAAAIASTLESNLTAASAIPSNPSSGRSSSGGFSSGGGGGFSGGGGGGGGGGGW